MMRPSERGFAQGLTHAASRLGAALTPALVVLIMLRFGWRVPFLLFGFMGLAWVVVWFWYYRDTPAQHHFINSDERSRIENSIGVRSAGAKTVPWRRILEAVPCGCFADVLLLRLCYLYLSGLVSQISQRAPGFNRKQMEIYASLPLLAGAAGDITGGTVSDLCARRFGSLKIARRAVALAGFLLPEFSFCRLHSLRIPQRRFYIPASPSSDSKLPWEYRGQFRLDIGGDCAGTIASVIEHLRKPRKRGFSILLAYLVGFYGWNLPFLVCSVLCVAGAVLTFGIDADKKIVLEAT